MSEIPSDSKTQPKPPGAQETTAEPSAPPTAPQPEAASATAKTGTVPPSLIAIAGGFLLLIAIVATSPFWASMLPWAPGDGDIAARIAALETRPGGNAAARQMEQRLGEVDQRISRLDDQVRNAFRNTAPDPTLAARLSALEQRVQTLSDPQATQPLQNDIHQTAERVARLEEQLRARENFDRRDRALLLAIGQLRAALSSSRPYGSELAAVAALGRDNPELLALLKPMEATAAKGVPSLTLLAQHFAPSSDRILRAAAAPTGDSFGERALARIQSLVTIRRIGSPGKPAASGDPTEDAVNTAEAALASGDLGAAVTAIHSLSGPAAEAAKPWLMEAENRLDAEKALAKVETYATAQLVNGGKAAP